MIRKTLIITAILFMALFVYGNILQVDDFLSSAISSISASSTATNGSEFTSSEPDLVSDDGHVNVDGMAAIEITFTGDGSMDGSDIDFYFQISLDGTSWSTDELVIINCPSNTPHDTNIVRHVKYVAVKWEKIRLWKVVNNDAANSITAVNATIAW